jgi:1-acyl-sn-glycerol-3-phosphate acyltransferase
VISDERLAALHAYTRKHSVNWPLYVVIRLLFIPFFLVYFRLSRPGRKYARSVDGGLIVASNHRSFLDPFVVGACLPFRRPMNYVAKVELFQKP